MFPRHFQVFPDAEALDKHRREGDASLRCCQCGKRFASASKLAAHGRKHSREKPFRCSGCGKFYTHRATLARHRLHYCQAASAGRAAEDLCLEKPLLTEDCLDSGQQSSHESSLPTTTAATPLSNTSCRVCRREFFDAQSLASHTNSHITSRTCCACHRTLGNRSKLITHHRTHTGESPYSCTFCGKLTVGKHNVNSLLSYTKTVFKSSNFSLTQVVDLPRAAH